MWVGELSDLERMSMASYVDNGHDFTLYTYEDLEGIPDGVIVRDAQEILPKSQVFTHMGGSLAGFGDAFRFELIYRKGGCWVDLDTVCLQPLRFEQDFIFASEEHKELGTHPNPNILCAPAKSRPIDFGRRLVKEMRVVDSDAPIGPRILKRTIEAYRMGGYVSPYTLYNPIAWWDLDSMLSPDFDWDIIRDSYTVHFWNEMWRRKNLDKNAEYPETSLYQTLRQRYLRKNESDGGGVLIKSKELKKISGNSDATTTVLVTTHLRDQCLQRCLDSIKRWSPGVPVMVQETGGNVSWARNKLLQECDTPFSIIMEEDMWFTDQTKIDKLTEILVNDSEILIAGGIIDDQWDVWAHDWCPEKLTLMAKPTTRPERTTIYGTRYQPANLISQFGAVRTAEARQFPWNEELPLREHLQWFWSWRHQRLAALTDACTVKHDSARPSNKYIQQRSRFIGLHKRAELKIGLKIVPILGNFEFSTRE